MTQSAPVSPLRIGLLVDKTTVSKYVYDFAKWAQDRPNLVVTHLILDLDPAQHPNKPSKFLNLLATLKSLDLRYTFASLPSKVLFRISYHFERLLLNRNERYRDHLKQFDLSQVIPRLVPNQIVITPIASKFGSTHSFAEDEIAKLKPLNLDLIIGCGGAILRGDILTVTKLGVISFCDADNKVTPGAPAGFWEVYFRHDTTGFVIQKLEEDSADARALLRGRIQTQYYYLLNQASLYEISCYYLKFVVDKIAVDRKLLPTSSSLPYSNRALGSPGAIVALLYLAKLLGRVGKNNLQRLLGLKLRWNVAFVRSDWRNAVLWRSFRIKNRPFHYLADPFLVITREGKEFCFVEDFDCRREKGNIAAYALEERDGTYLGTALEEPFHLSFPFIFEYQNELYMCPESSANRDIRIYRCLEFPLRWELAKIVMKDISAVDSVIFEMNGKWWMFTNIDSSGLGDPLELSIFCAESPFSDHWESHPQNPILLDSTRNVGLIRDDGHHYFRISQCRGFNLYGKKVLINEVRELTQSNYAETPVAEVAPNFEPGILGVHHFDSKGKITLFDYLNLSRIHK